MPDPDDPLAKLREQIDACDDELLATLNRRARLVEEVGAHKQNAGGTFYRPARERAIIDRLQAANPGPFPDRALRPVFQEVISACLSLEKGMRVAYLGPEATFTHQAVKRHFGTSAVTVPCGSISGVFDEIDRGQADFGVVPVENSSGGVVNHTLDEFVASDLTIRAELVVQIDQVLMVSPGLKEADIERVYSHPQGLAQCRKWLESHLPQASLRECPSTTNAARRARDDGAGAAIASELAARMYGLEVLRHQLQDVTDNVTRFLVIGKGPPEPPVEDAEYKTSLLLVLPDEAGFLYRMLQPFSEADINLTKIESRPLRRQLWDYVFFLDLDGHCDDPAIAPVLAQLASSCELFKILGSYRKADTT